MDFSEKWGRDVEEAVRLALEDLHLTEDQVKVTVLEEPSKGFFGIGSKPVSYTHLCSPSVLIRSFFSISK